ncbi:MAG TPA: phenylalanine--tRNA ligase subunit alpha [Candidatus Limnocylindria bacterium]|nr:phenylalanine--tRNA ligase subunit alpha [Candidatus Limnocylindria bacterium]
MTDIRSELDAIERSSGERLAAASSVDAVEALRHELLGRSGALTGLLRQLGSVPAEERPAIGQRANEVRRGVEAAIQSRLDDLSTSDLEARLADEAIDMSAPGRPLPVGHLHPVQTTTRDLREIFHAYGFEVFEGPEIETEEYNFELLNIPPDHPSRDLWDTLYVAEPGSVAAGAPRPAEDGTILRTHTSPVQIRAMRALEPPIRVLMPGRCFRYEAVDASHASEFFQVEGLVVDRDTSLADLKGTLEEVARALYGRDVRTRFRPGYYPFTEPSVAFDIGCLVCGGSGCPACKRSGWMTILGAGMVHPVVLRAGGYDPDEFQGYAFGMGPDRMTMLRHGIGDIRLFFSADLRFVTQFTEGR